MRGIYVADVGDGLCMAIRTISGDVVQIDCGSQEIKVASNGLKRIFNHFYGFDVFVLSHFHIDHYGGLLNSSIKFQRYPSFRVREVYYPRIPKFRERRQFLCKLFAMNMRVFGSETGVMEYDFLRAITRINRGISFWHQPVSKGDLININGSIFEIVWPPAVIDDDRTLADIRRALDDFNDALEKDETTRELYERVREEGVFEEYLGQQDEKNGFREYEGEYTHTIVRRKEKRELPEAVKKANKSLRKAANHLGLALFEDNRLLFLGDTEKSEIKQIVDGLKSRTRKDFLIFIPPHHGTHWHSSLGQMRCIYSIASNGKKLCSKMNPHFKEISEKSLATFVNGDIIIPGDKRRGFSLILPRFYEEI
ncbi:MAG: hypothetical protein OEY88_04660 [Candidatus Bathyarchaeota archaeon]|nr:hypothetical protein [Candidatus Bathyarchaeota archaeon]